ncbi:MAG: hypothetical protein PHH47_10930 [Gallionella sp.]|nr:hypothetical protein [Gallionella sp.]
MKWHRRLLSSGCALLWGLSVQAAEAPAEGARLVVQIGHLEAINTLAVAPDGKTIATGGDDHSVKIWSFSSGRELRTLAGHQGKVSGVAYSSDGTQLVSVSQEWHDGVKIWDVATGYLARTITLPEYSSCYAVAFHGMHVAAGCLKGILIWNLADNSAPQVLHGHQGVISAIRFSADGKKLVSGGWDKTVRLWDVASGNQTGELSGQGGEIYSVDHYCPVDFKFISL